MLRPRKKVTKREIQEDALVTLYLKAQKFLRIHIQKVYIGIGALAVVAIVIVFMGRSKKQAEIQASGKLGIAEQFFYGQDYQRAVPELQQIIDTYPGTRSAGTATFLLAKADFSTGNVGHALTLYRDYADHYKHDKIFSAAAYAGMGACYDQQGNYEAAAVNYEKAAKAHPKLFLAPFYYKDAARCYTIAGNTAKAVEIYQKIHTDYATSSVAQEASFYLESLSTDSPSL
jgi:TolA-binding protein